MNCPDLEAITRLVLERYFVPDRPLTVINGRPQVVSLTLAIKLAIEEFDLASSNSPLHWQAQIAWAHHVPAHTVTHGLDVMNWMDQFMVRYSCTFGEYGVRCAKALVAFWVQQWLVSNETTRLAVTTLSDQRYANRAELLRSANVALSA